MSNFDEDIKRISDEMMNDGTIDGIIRDKLKKAYESSIESAFRFGALSNAIEKRIEEVMVPAVEKADLSEYVTKLDNVLSEVIKATALPDYKKLLQNFKDFIRTDLPKSITLEDLLSEYNKFVAADIDCCGREVVHDEGDPEYQYVQTYAEIDEDESRYYNRPEHAVLRLHIDEDEEEDNENALNREVKLTRYSWEKEDGWRIEYGNALDIQSLRYMPSFDVYLLALSQNGTRLIGKICDCEEDSVTPDAKPEVDFV